MNFQKEDLLLYAVTDRRWLRGQKLYDQVQKALQGGVTMVQLREKNMKSLEEAFEIKELCRRYRVPFIINDDADIAKRVGADGVHVGQSDIDPKSARAILGPGKIIGVSARTKEQAVLAQEQGADYIGVGAVFSTGIKRDAKVIGCKQLKEVCESVDIPVVAIGGITMHSLPRLAGSGIDGIAAVSAIFAQGDIVRAASDLKKAVFMLQQ